MRLGSRRGSAVLEAPEESYALETNVSPEVAVREPAPAGALQREAAGAFADEPRSHYEEEEYVPRRSSGFKFKLNNGVPKSLAGRIILGSGAVLVLGSVVVGIAGVRKYLMHDDRFAVATSSEIEIQGNEHLTRAQILSVFGADLERNIFKVPLAERRADLERLPWVSHATVMRLLPNHLRIAVTERTPVAFVRQGTQIGLVDAGGVLLDMPPQSAGDPHYSFPVLTGLNADDPLSTRAARMAVYAKFMKELDSGGQKLSQNLSEVDVSNPEDVKALVASGGTDILVHFGDEQFLERYHEFQQHLPEWKQQYPKLASADMRYERQVVLEMTPGTGTPLAETVGASAAPAAAAPVAKAPATKPAAPAGRVKKSSEGAAERKSKAASARAVLEQRIAQARSAHVANTVVGQGGR